VCHREIALMRRPDRRGEITFIDVAALRTACLVDQAAQLALLCLGRWSRPIGSRSLCGHVAYYSAAAAT
jgi:hypothetical protein